MAQTQFMDNPLLLWVNYDTAPARITSITVANPYPVAATVQVQRNNGQWTTFTIPANTPPTQYSVNPAQYTITVNAQGEIDVCPNIQTF